MWSSGTLIVAVLLHLAALVSAENGSATNQWQTLKGKPPLVIARGGFSGLLPGFTDVAYKFTLAASVPNVLFWCDVQLTKEGAGICFPDLLLQNSSDVDNIYPKKDKRHKTYTVDYTLKELANVSVTQGIYNRIDRFDGNFYQILTVEDVAKLLQPPAGLWLNIQNNIFFSQHNLSMRNYVNSVMKKLDVNYISLPEVAFLNSIKGAVSPKTTKLVFRFLGQNEIEPSTNQTYGSLLNLTFIKTFASGILVPKTYIYPVTSDNYLEPHTSLVSDAHKAGLTVSASDFANDATLPYNYSYDPLAEYFSFIDNGVFAVDGVLSDFPITPSAAIDCFAPLSENTSAQDIKPLVISKNGASGDYPDCTNLAYNKALEDGVDVLDCPVQMSKDGIPFCSSSIILNDITTVVQSSFRNLTMVIPDIQAEGRIYTFSLAWDQIKTLQPSISNPQRRYELYRNPRFRMAGSYLTLSDFLTLAKKKSSLSGALISIEYAAYLVEKQGLSVTDAVITELNKARLDNHAGLDIMIQSTNSSVLMKFKEKTKCKLVYKVKEVIRDALNTTLEDIKKFADAVVINKASLFPVNVKYVTGATDVVTMLHAFDLPVYVELFSNEYLSQAWDFFSDPTVEISSFVSGANVDGVITDFPKTAARYKRNKCLSYKERPSYMKPVEPGALLTAISLTQFPPAEAPNPVLTENDVTEPPLPSALAPWITRGPTAASSSPTAPPNGQPKMNAAYFFISNLVLLAIVATLLQILNCVASHVLVVFKVPLKLATEIYIFKTSHKLSNSSNIQACSTEVYAQHS